jgi:hypothetical protein
MAVTWQFVHKLKKLSLVEEFEAANHISLPTDLRECIKANNAGMPDKFVFNTEQSQERVFNSLFSYTPGDLDNIYDVFPVFAEMEQGLIPFASDPFGNTLCVKDNKIVLYLHETDRIENVADSFSELEEKLYFLED